MIEPCFDLFAEFVEAARHRIQRIASVTDLRDDEGITLADFPPL
jgi:hypothetical protein